MIIIVGSNMKNGGMLMINDLINLREKLFIELFCLFMVEALDGFE